MKNTTEKAARMRTSQPCNGQGGSIKGACESTREGGLKP